MNCGRCNCCEKEGNGIGVVLLLGEIIRGFQLKTGIWYLAAGRPCPYSSEGLCAIHACRPIDCQSFPVVPFDGGRQVRRDPVCPLAFSDVVAEHIDHWARKWKEIGPLLSPKWWEFYESMNRRVIEMSRSLT
jgi:Fe-S-cluster containining protein